MQQLFFPKSLCSRFGLGRRSVLPAPALASSCVGGIVAIVLFHTGQINVDTTFCSHIHKSVTSVTCEWVAHLAWRFAEHRTRRRLLGERSARLRARRIAVCRSNSCAGRLKRSAGRPQAADPNLWVCNRRDVLELCVCVCVCSDPPFPWYGRTVGRCGRRWRAWPNFTSGPGGPHTRPPAQG